MNKGYRYRNVVDSGAAGKSVLAFYSASYRHSTDLEWLERIEGGAVLLDGRRVSGDAVLRAGQILTYDRAPWVEPEAPATFGVIYVDDQIIAVDKPVGLPVLPGGHHLDSTLLALVRARFSGAVPPSPVHRIGRGTSGIVLFARTKHARRELTAAFAQRRIEKVYRALVQGVGLPAEQDIDVPIGRIPYPPTGCLYAATADGSPSKSTCTLVREDRGRSQSLVEIRIHTGRTQQIRIHTAAIGHPLVGDPLYVGGGGPAQLIEGEHAPLPGDCGYHLHATHLAFQHPITHEYVEIDSTPPPLLQ